MLFPTVDFAIFFVIVFTVGWLLRPHHTAWRIFVLAASFVFYGYWDNQPVVHLVGPLRVPGYTVLLAASILGNHGFGHLARRSLGPGRTPTPASRRVVLVAAVANLGALAYFKYTGFFVETASGVAKAVGVDYAPVLPEIVLPIAISFFTFQALSYIVDCGRGEIEEMSLLDFAVYLSFFPHLVAGPIVRATEFVPQIRRPADPRRIPSTEAFALIAAGLFKKLVISSYVASQIVDPVFALPGHHSSWEVLVGIYAYAVQIYCDFSGYTDIAIGCALLLGIRFPQNFDAPYIATSMQDFWRRWHMTLSRWLRDYLYIPLGGNQRGESRTEVNLLATMVIGGLWHGAAWHFVVWGGIHGAALAVERRVKAWWAERGPIGLPRPLVRGLQWLCTFHVVCFAWIFFRAPTLSGDAGAWSVLGRLVSGLGAPSPLVTSVLLASVIGAVAVQFVPRGAGAHARVWFARLPPTAQGVVLASALLVISEFGPDGVPTFIYFQF